MLIDRNELYILLHIANLVLVGQHRAFRISCRSRRIHQGTNIVFRQFAGYVRSCRCIFRKCLFIQTGKLDEITRHRKRRIGNEKLGPRILHNIIHFPVHQRIIDRNDNGAQRRDAHIHIHKLRTIGGIQADPVPFADTQGIQSISVAIDSLFQLPVRDRRSADISQMPGIGIFKHFVNKHNSPH